MSTAPVLQSQMHPIGRSVRAYFAPVDRVNGTPAIFDPCTGFDPDAPTKPWIDLGCVENFARTPQTAVNAVRTGESGAVAAQYRSAIDARVECEFLNWGKLQMALAGGSVHYNVLAGVGGSLQPCGGQAAVASTLMAGSTATQLVLEAAALAGFAAGELVAVDVDYRGEAGYVGSGIAAAYVPANDGVMRDMDFTRRATFNVGRVQSKTATSLVLAQALPGGDPQVNAAVQKVAGFVDREGGSYFQEWSAVFVMPSDSGGQICFFYPRLQVLGGAAEGVKEIASPIVGRTLKAVFRAMPMVDGIDGEACVCWRSYLPSESAAAF
ncbi:hypothetical protein Acid345_4357 [Candidatus Koribacter versatilis Ellin345]|uniref:Uncharacterized protein n=1 Tax=Koribacter versatilis (strain Ellin345) TaxID=204669 RepID=Q1IIE3_KORVE|nr:hypothetical protein [Candidatus Koribacter versatilis]ABF43357.1 hypothetical protein Acid345_4357 [Candidatus Koribacter versatilis Ellin345]